MRKTCLFVCALLTITGSLFGAAEQYAYPRFLASYGKNVEIDGIVQENEWADASSYSGFLHNYPLGEDGRAFPLLYSVPSQTTIWIKWDDEKLYIAFRCERKKGVELGSRIEPDQRDKNLTREECIELFFVANEVNYFFVGNTLGAIFDGKNRPGEIDKWDGAWNGDWQYKTNVEEDYWQGEISIRFGEFGIEHPEEGMIWKFTASRYQPGFSRSSLTPVGGLFFNPSTYGELAFSKSFRINSLYPAVKYRRGFKTSITNLSADAKKAELTAGIYPAGTGDEKLVLPDVKLHFAFEGEPVYYSQSSGKGVSETLNLQPGETKNFLAMMPAKSGEKFLSLTAASSGEFPLFSQSVPMAYEEELPIAVKIEKQILTHGKINVIVRGYTVKGEDVSCELIDSAGNLANKTVLKKEGGKDFVWEMPVKGLNPGNYSLKVVTSEGSQTTALKIPELPEWHLTKSGITDAILPPFKPIKGTADGLEFTFGQKYRFINSFLPEQIQTLWGESILAGSPEFLVEAGGERIVLRAENLKKKKISDGVVEYTGTYKGAGITIEGKSRVEYDGFVWTEIRLDSDKEISKFILQIPVKEEASTYYKLMAPDIVSGSSIVRGRLPADTVKAGFYPCVWIGDIEKGGLEWTCESERGWSNSNEKEKILIERGQDRTMLSFRFIDKVIKPGSANYSFGLLSTPIFDPRRNYMKDTAYITSPNTVDAFQPYTEGGRNLNFWFYGRKAPSFFNRGVVAVYPLSGNIIGDEGKIEFLAKILPGGKQQSAMDVFLLDMGPDSGIHMQWVSDDVFWTERGFRIKVYWRGKMLELLESRRLDWKVTEQFQQVALAWEKQAGGKTLFVLYGNGEEIGRKIVDIDLTLTDWKDKYFFLGGNTQAVFDELKITGGNKILLYDRYEEDFAPNNYLQTKADVISGSSGETGGWIDMWAEFTEGSEGKGLKLSTQTTKDPFQLAGDMGADVFHIHYWHRNKFGCWWLPENKEKEETIHQWVKAVGNAGGRTSVYYLKNISPEDPYWEDFGEEMLLNPLRPSINNYVLCPKGPGTDFFVWTVEQIIRRYGVDGIHNDYGELMACENLEHGCGWVDENGKVRKSWPILEQRRMNQRVYGLLHGILKKNGVYRNHTSSAPILATVGFADIFVTGEYEAMSPKNGKPIGDWLPEDNYLSFYSSYITGIPAFGGHTLPWEIMAGEGTGASQTHLLKDYPLFNPEGYFDPYRVPSFAFGMRSQVQMFYPAFKDFSNAEFIGFWKTKELAETKTADGYAKKYIRTSIWKDAGEKKALILVGNVGGIKKEVHLKINFPLLGLEENNSIVRDVYTREVFPTDGVRVEVEKESIRLLLVRERYAGRQ